MQITSNLPCNMEVYHTQRLSVRQLSLKDKAYFIELFSAPEIINQIPQPYFSLEEIEQKFVHSINYEVSPLDKDKTVWGVFENNNDELIGLCALLTNDESDRELGYRFRKKFWGKGYATELTHGMITYCFNELQLELITADVSVTNTPSVKVLEKFFIPVREFYNERDKSTDRRYHLERENWKS